MDTHVERLVGDAVHNVLPLRHEDRPHGGDKVLWASSEVPEISIDLGFNVEQDRLVRRALDKVEHLLQSRDLSPRVDLWPLARVCLIMD